MNDLGSVLCIDKRGERKRHTPQRGGKEVRWGSLSTNSKDRERERRDTETDKRPKQKRQTAKTKQNQCKLEKKKINHSREKSASPYHTYVLA